MEKYNFDIDTLDSNKFIDELKKDPRLKDKKITVINANMYKREISDNDNCKNCKGLTFCKNEVKGYYSKVSSDLGYDTLTVVPCKYKINNDSETKKSNLIKTLYLPDNVLDSTLNDFRLDSKERAKAYQEATDFISNIKNNKTNVKGLMFTGQFGTGKTYLASSIANELKNYNIESLMIYFPDLAREIKNSIGSDRFDKIINMVKEIDLLILDDLGAEYITTWLRDEVLGPILNYRYQALKPIIITSNLSLTELMEHFANTESKDIIKGGRLVKRIQAMCKVITLN